MKTPLLNDLAQSHLRDILNIVFRQTQDKHALIVSDSQSALSLLLTRAYRTVLPDATVVDFDQSDPDAILSLFDALSPGDLVILVQSASFRLSKFRIRIELFQRQLKVIEHPHLARIQDTEFSVYIEALAYDPAYYRTLGPQLKRQIAQASEINIIGTETELTYDTCFLDPKLNIGHYEDMKNIGGQFPIGEVFTEPQNLLRVNGEITLFAFGDTRFRVNVPEKPFTARIQEGILVDCEGAPESFKEVLDSIRREEDVVWVRELGFGLNRALTQTRRVSDIGTYERMCGIHLSLGGKHLQYKKPVFSKKGGFHVDVFADAKRVEIDGVTVYTEGAYLLECVNNPSSTPFSA